MMDRLEKGSGQQVNIFKPILLAHLTQRVMWAILITWRPSSSSVVRRPSVVRRTS
jgi:hypothetical protein